MPNPKQIDLEDYIRVQTERDKRALDADFAVARLKSAREALYHFPEADGLNIDIDIANLQGVLEGLIDEIQSITDSTHTINGSYCATWEGEYGMNQADIWADSLRKAEEQLCASHPEDIGSDGTWTLDDGTELPIIW